MRQLVSTQFAPMHFTHHVSFKTPSSHCLITVCTPGTTCQQRMTLEKTGLFFAGVMAPSLMPAGPDDRLWLDPSLMSVVGLSVRLSVSPSLCLSVCLSVRLSVCPSVRPSLRLSVSPSLRPSVSLSVFPSARLSVCPSARLSVCPSVRPSVRLSVCPSVRLSVCPSVRLSVCPSVCLSVCECVRRHSTVIPCTVLLVDTDSLCVCVITIQTRLRLAQACHKTDFHFTW